MKPFRLSVCLGLALIVFTVTSCGPGMSYKEFADSGTSKPAGCELIVLMPEDRMTEVPKLIGEIYVGENMIATSFSQEDRSVFSLDSAELVAGPGARLTPAIAASSIGHFYWSLL